MQDVGKGHSKAKRVRSRAYAPVRVTVNLGVRPTRVDSVQGSVRVGTTKPTSDLIGNLDGRLSERLPRVAAIKL